MSSCVGSSTSDFFWATKTIDLSAYDGSDNLIVAFVNIGGYGQALYLDNILVESSETLSVIDQTINNELLVYPNPTSNKLTIKTSYDVDKVELYNILGKKVIESTNLELNLNPLSDGVYILQIYSGETKLIKRIVKQ